MTEPFWYFVSTRNSNNGPAVPHRTLRIFKFKWKINRFISHHHTTIVRSTQHRFNWIECIVGGNLIQGPHARYEKLKKMTYMRKLQTAKPMPSKSFLLVMSHVIQSSKYVMTGTLMHTRHTIAAEMMFSYSYQRELLTNRDLKIERQREKTKFIPIPIRF